MKKIILLFALLLSVSAYARVQDTPPIPLQGGDVPPGGTLKINLSPLKNCALYNIHCDIINSNRANEVYPIVLSFFFEYYAPNSVLLNGIKILQSGSSTTGISYQGELTSEKNQLDAIQWTACYNNYFIITNFDNSDTATVQNCYAEFSTQ